MELVIIVLVVIIFLLITYLFFIKRDLRRITKSIVDTKTDDSNKLIHSEMSLKEISNLIKEINILIKECNNNKISYNKKNKHLRKMITNF